MWEKPTEPGRGKVPSGTCSPPTFPGGHHRTTPPGRTGRPLLPGRRSQRHASHLPCTSCRCPAAARRWGRRRCRKAPSGTAGRGGSSPRCPPHTACGLGETGQGGRKFQNRAPRPPMPWEPQCVPLPNRHPPGASGVTTAPHPTSPLTPTTPGHQPPPTPPISPSLPHGPGVSIFPPPIFYKRPSSPAGPHKGHLLQEGHLQPSLAGSQNLPIWS